MAMECERIFRKPWSTTRSEPDWVTTSASSVWPGYLLRSSMPRMPSRRSRGSWNRNRWESYANFPSEHALGAYLVVSTAISQRELYFQLIDLSAPFHPALRARAE